MLNYFSDFFFGDSVGFAFGKERLETISEDIVFDFIVEFQLVRKGHFGGSVDKLVVVYGQVDLHDGSIGRMSANNMQ